MTAPVAQEFPTDNVTLDLLWTALHPGPDAERTSVGDLLDLLSDMHFGPLGEPEELADDIAYRPGTRWSTHDVIAALVTEVRRLRATS